MKFISVKGYDNFEDMGFKCGDEVIILINGDEVIILINGGEVKHGIMQDCYNYLEVYVGVWGDLRTYDFYRVSAVAKLNF